MGLREEAEKAFQVEAQRLLHGPALGETMGKMWGSGGDFFAPNTFKAIQELIEARGKLFTGPSNPYKFGNVVFQPLGRGDFPEIQSNWRDKGGRLLGLTRSYTDSPNSQVWITPSALGSAPLAVVAHETVHTGQPSGPGRENAIRERVEEITNGGPWWRGQKPDERPVVIPKLSEIEPQLVEYQLMKELKKRGFDLPISEGRANKNPLTLLVKNIDKFKNVVPNEFVDAVAGIIKKFPKALYSVGGEALNFIGLYNGFQDFEQREGRKPSPLELYLETMGMNPVTDEQKNAALTATGGT